MIELISLEVEFLSHSRDVGIVEVGPVKIVDKVAEAAERQDEQIQLAQKLGLSRHTLLAFDVGCEFSEHPGEFCLPPHKYAEPAFILRRVLHC